MSSAGLPCRGWVRGESNTELSTSRPLRCSGWRRHAPSTAEARCGHRPAGSTQNRWLAVINPSRRRRSSRSQPRNPSRAVQASAADPKPANATHWPSTIAT